MLWGWRLLLIISLVGLIAVVIGYIDTIASFQQLLSGYQMRQKELQSAVALKFKMATVQFVVIAVALSLVGLLAWKKSKKTDEG